MKLLGHLCILKADSNRVQDIQEIQEILRVSLVPLALWGGWDISTPLALLPPQPMGGPPIMDGPHNPSRVGGRIMGGGKISSPPWCKTCMTCLTSLPCLAIVLQLMQSHPQWAPTFHTPSPWCVGVLGMVWGGWVALGTPRLVVGSMSHAWPCGALGIVWGDLTC